MIYDNKSAFLFCVKKPACKNQQVLQLNAPAIRHSGSCVSNPGVRRIPTGPKMDILGELMRCLKHLHQEGVNGRVANQFKEEKVLQTLETDGAQCW